MVLSTPPPPLSSGGVGEPSLVNHQNCVMQLEVAVYTLHWQKGSHIFMLPHCCCCPPTIHIVTAHFWLHMPPPPPSKLQPCVLRPRRMRHETICTVISCRCDTGGDACRQIMAKLWPCLSYSGRTAWGGGGLRSAILPQFYRIFSVMPLRYKPPCRCAKVSYCRRSTTILVHPGDQWLSCASRDPGGGFRTANHKAGPVFCSPVWGPWWAHWVLHGHLVFVLRHGGPPVGNHATMRPDHTDSVGSWRADGHQRIVGVKRSTGMR